MQSLTGLRKAPPGSGELNPSPVAARDEKLARIAWRFQRHVDSAAVVHHSERQRTPLREQMRIEPQSIRRELQAGRTEDDGLPQPAARAQMDALRAVAHPIIQIDVGGVPQMLARTIELTNP